MSDPAKEPTVTTTVETRDASGQVMRQRLTTQQNEFGNTPQGIQANIWAKLGMLAAITIFFGGAMLWMMNAVNSQVDLLRDELKDARLQAATERKDMVDRYLASRELQEQRHRETLTKLDKVITFVDAWFNYIMKEQRPSKGTFGQPKMDDIK